MSEAASIREQETSVSALRGCWSCSSSPPGIPYPWDRVQLFQKMSGQERSNLSNLTCADLSNWNVQVKPSSIPPTQSRPWSLLLPKLCQVFSGRVRMIKRASHPLTLSVPLLLSEKQAKSRNNDLQSPLIGLMPSLVQSSPGSQLRLLKASLQLREIKYPYQICVLIWIELCFQGRNQGWITPVSCEKQ